LTFPLGEHGEIVRPYVVVQGDYLTKVAHVLGFDAEEIWEHPKNTSLRETRAPNVLSPGDILYVPDAPPDRLPLELGASNSYTGQVPEVTVSVLLCDHDQPVAGEPYVVKGLRTPLEGTTSATGLVSFPVPVDCVTAELGLPRRELSLLLLIGHLDPVDTPSGQRARLENLGLKDRGAPDPEALAGDDDDSLELQRATRAFQAARGLPQTGDFDEQTREALEMAHGL